MLPSTWPFENFDVVRLILEPGVEQQSAVAPSLEQERAPRRRVRSRTPAASDRSARRPRVAYLNGRSRAAPPSGPSPVWMMPSRTRDAARQNDRSPPSASVVVRAGVAAGPARCPWFVERRIGGVMVPGIVPDRPQQRLLCEHASRHLVRESVARRGGVRGVDREESAAVEASAADGCGRTVRSESTRMCLPSPAASS